MLGLASGLQYPNSLSEFSPLNYSNLIAWWDATDIDTLWTHIAGTGTPSNADDISRIDNKAFLLQGNTTDALGAFLGQDGAASFKPHYNSSKAGIDFNGGGANEYLRGTRDIGPADTSGGFDVFSQSTINTRNVTIFYVIQQSSATLSQNSGLLSLKDAGPQQELRIFGSSSNNHKIYTTIDNSGTAFSNDSGVDATTNKELWTVKLDGSANSIYRNGDTSAGITGGTASNTDLTFDANSPKYYVALGFVVNTSSDFMGTFFEMLIYNRALSISETQEIEANLKIKHNIS